MSFQFPFWEANVCDAKKQKLLCDCFFFLFFFTENSAFTRFPSLDLHQMFTCLRIKHLTNKQRPLQGFSLVLFLIEKFWVFLQLWLLKLSQKAILCLTPDHQKCVRFCATWQKFGCPYAGRNKPCEDNRQFKHETLTPMLTQHKSCNITLQR